MISCEDKYAAMTGADRMLQIVVAQRLPGDDQTYRVQLRGVSRNSALRLGWLQLESATAPTDKLPMPDSLLCPVRRELFSRGINVIENVTVQVKLDAEHKKVVYRCEKSSAVGGEEQTLADMPLPADVDVTKLFLAALLDAPGDAAYLLPSEAELSWAPRY